MLEIARYVNNIFWKTEVPESLQTNWAKPKAWESGFQNQAKPKGSAGLPRQAPLQ